MWLVPLECRNTAVYSYVYSMCDFVGIRVKFKEETAAVKCNKPMVLIKQSWTKCMLNQNKHSVIYKTARNIKKWNKTNSFIFLSFL